MRSFVAFLLALVVAATAVSAVQPAAPTAQTPVGRTLVSYAETNALRTGEWWNLFQRADGDYRSNTYATLAVGPFDFQVGDVIDSRLFHEFDSEAPGAGAWTVNGVQSEHWFRWTMASTAVYLGTSAQMGCAGCSWVGGTPIMPAQEFNWDWLVHHGPVSRASYYRVAAACTGCYVYDRVYFLSGKAYTLPDGPASNRQVQLNSGQYAELQVAVYR